MIKLGQLKVTWHHIMPPTLDQVVIHDEDGSVWVKQLDRNEFAGTVCIVRIDGIDVVEHKVVGRSRLHRFTEFEAIDAYRRGVRLDLDPLGFERFNKEIGRKISLQRALDQILWMTAEDRVKVWEDYFNRSKKPDLLCPELKAKLQILKDEAVAEAMKSLEGNV